MDMKIHKSQKALWQIREAFERITKGTLFIVGKYPCGVEMFPLFFLSAPSPLL